MAIFKKIVHAIINIFSPAIGKNEHVITKLPEHVAIIMDGNGRWAKNKFLPVTLGHAKGALVSWAIAEEASRLGIKVLTVFAFSSENWQRDDDEVKNLIETGFRLLDQKIESMQQQKMRLYFIGDRTKLSAERQATLKTYEELTEKNEGLKFVIAFSYSGQWDIVQATTQMIQQYKNSELKEAIITPEIFSSFLSTRQLPPCDLLIRTGGEIRISNFLLWQIAYAELYFVDTLWPAFTAKEFHKALANYDKRDRRYGKRL